MCTNTKKTMACRPAVQAAQQSPRRNNELQILHIRVALRNRWMVIQHQQEAGPELDREGAQSQRAQIPRFAEPQLRFQDARRHDFREVPFPAFDGVQWTVQVRVFGGWQHSFCLHAVTYSECAATRVARSTIRLPSSASHIFSQGSACGAGPAIVRPSFWKVLPWQ